MKYRIKDHLVKIMKDNIKLIGIVFWTNVLIPFHTYRIHELSFVDQNLFIFLSNLCQA